MEDAGQITKKIEETMGKFQPRFDRMDKDFERWDMKSVGQRYTADYVAKEHLRTAQIRDTDIEIITNDFRTFSDDVQSILSSSDRQIAVRMAEASGQDMRDEMGKLERLLEYAFEEADERLINLLLGTLKENLVWYSIVRGWAAARFVIYKDKKDVVFDFLPYDPRWLAYQVGANGLLWTGYTTSLTPEAIRDEYGEAGQDATSGTWWKLWGRVPDTIPRIDYWKDLGNGKKSNSIICNNKFLKKEETYDLDSMPVLIAPVATRPPIRGNSQTEMEGYGDSIFAPNRRTGDLLNKLASMWASHANLLYRQPIVNYRGTSGIEIKDTLHYAGGVINLPAGENKLDEVPMKEISVTLVNLVNWAEGKRVRGSLPDIEPGSKFESGTLYNLVQEAGNRVWNPQLRNMNSFYGNACRLIFEQLRAGGVGGDKIKKFKIQGQYKNKYFEDEITPPDLKRAHTINVTFTARTPWQQMDVIQQADMLKRLGLPESWINEYILKLPDPKLISDLVALEMYEHSPEGMMKRAVEVLMDRGYAFEAQKLVEQMDKMGAQEDAQLQTQQQAAMPQEETEPTPPVVEEGGGI